MGNTAETLTKAPWRKSTATAESLREEIKEIDPGCLVNCLMYGPVAAGKSSVVNSFMSIPKGRRVKDAPTGASTTSVTLHLNKFENKALGKVCLWDIMGTEPASNEGISSSDVVELLAGHIKAGYEFNPKSPITEKDKYYKSSPGIEEQVHCVAFVLESTNVNGNKIKPYFAKIKEVQRELIKLKMPYVLILTNIDEQCSGVKDDIRNTFRSIKVRDAVTAANEALGFSKGDIHPVQNFEVVIEVENDTSFLLLLALRQIMHYAFDRIEKLRGQKPKNTV